MLRPVIITALLLLSGSCHNHDPQPSFKAFEEHSARVPPEGTIPVTRPLEPPDARGFPRGMKLTEKELEEGKRHFENTCIACHGWNGKGDGIAVHRGLKGVVSFHDDKYRSITPAKIVETITNGEGTMPSYARRLTLKERWLVAAYVKALQFSQRMPVGSLTKEDREKIP